MPTFDGGDDHVRIGGPGKRLRVILIVLGSQIGQGHGTFVAVSEGVWLGHNLGGSVGNAVTSNSVDNEPDNLVNTLPD